MNLTPIEDLIEEDFGSLGTPERDQFEMECDVFAIGEQLKDERLKAGVERGRADIQLSTLVNLFRGLGRQSLELNSLTDN